MSILNRLDAQFCMCPKCLENDLHRQPINRAVPIQAFYNYINI